MTASTLSDAPVAAGLAPLLRIDQRLAPVLDAPGIAEYLQHTHGRRPILNNAGIVGAAWLTAAPVWGPRRSWSPACGCSAARWRSFCCVRRRRSSESEKRFRSLTALSSDWYWEQDAQYRFVRFEGAAHPIPVDARRAHRPAEPGGVAPAGDAAVELAKRYERCFAILLLNVDRFQRMNDSLGREVGDALLRELTARVKKQLRASDVVARLDGDEFAVLAHELPTRGRPNRSRASCSMPSVRRCCCKAKASSASPPASASRRTRCMPPTSAR